MSIKVEIPGCGDTNSISTTLNPSNDTPIRGARAGRKTD